MPLSSHKDRLRYRHYFQSLQSFYQKPVTQVSSALLLTLATIIFFAAFAIRPTLATISELLKKIDDQKKVLADLKKKSTALSVAQSEYSLIADKIYIVDAAIPPDPQATSLIKLIEAAASAHNLPIKSLQLDNLILDSKPLKATENETILSLTVEATYGQLKPFIFDLSRLPRLVTVQEIRFSEPSENQVQEGETANIRTQIIIKAYQLPLESSK